MNSVQRLIRPVKTGHAGTLDPMATGVLLVCLGPGTRLVSVLQQAAKCYMAEFRLGQRSSTDDAEGEIQNVPDPPQPSSEEIRRELTSFCGVIEQRPPDWSAVKIGGRRAYALARKELNPDIQPRPVWIDYIDILAYDWPLLRVDVRCGSGTYIRSIARDLGQRLRCGGHMTKLERTAIGSFSVDDAVDPDMLSVKRIPELLISPLEVVAHISRYRCTDEECRLVERGGSFDIDSQRLTKVSVKPDRPHDLAGGGLPPVAIVSPCGTRLLALGEIRRQGRRIQPRSVFVRRA